MNREELLKAIDAKYHAMGQNPDVHLSGLLHAEPMTYWDFANVDALLSLQIHLLCTIKSTSYYLK
jgi:tryptophan 2,3-dioxygenase